MPRFVLLHHEFPPGHERASHWDLMIEADGALRTWALDEPPQVGKSAAAEPLADHRMEYLTYQGPISGGRGHVARWDEGTCEILEEAVTAIRLRLWGAKVAGVVTLEFAARE